MGICLDTDANTSLETDEPGPDWKGGGRNSARVRTGGSTVAMMQNAGKIKFDPPKVPVIFVLGGPGSGKVTHCDTLMQEKRGVVHINMMDLLQQYAMGNDMQDFSQLSSKTVTEVLMLEMKMAPAAKAYLISGYPRSMRDVVEYSEKIQVVNGVILISWRQSVLQKQIDYGAKLGHVVLSLAKMELENFFKNVMPVADYFDQSDMLIAVNGERAPTEVYKDFRQAALDILSTLENQEAILNGVSGMGKGIHDIPGSIVSVETAPSQEKNITDLSQQQQLGGNSNNLDAMTAATTLMANNRMNFNPTSQYETFGNNIGPTNLSDDIPPCIWVIGGPGSNKASLCLKAVGVNPGWTHLSVGRLLRAITDSAPRANTESYAIKEALAAGELAPEKAIQQMLDLNLRQLSDRKGVIIDGFPRNLEQADYFEKRYGQKPPIILLDCSKLQLGRGRIDDTVSSFRRRLELFRESTLPMLRTMDNSNRLIIVDGDTDSPSVQREFEKIIRSHIQRLTGSTNLNGGIAPAINPATIQHMSVMNSNNDAILQDLEDNVPGVVPTISHHISMANGNLRNPNYANGIAGGGQINGHLPNGNFRQMLNNADGYM